MTKLRVNGLRKRANQKVGMSTRKLTRRNKNSLYNGRLEGREYNSKEEKNYQSSQSVKLQNCNLR